MAKHEENKTMESVEQALSSSELFFRKNQQLFTYLLISIIILVGGYFAIIYLYIAPKEQAAAEEIFYAQRYFESDSLHMALNGDSERMGFIDIINSYNFTPTAKLAKYYAGISYLRLGKFQEAVNYLTDFKTSDPILFITSHQALGDAYLELDNKQEAINTYLKGSKKHINDQFTPELLLRAGFVYEAMEKYNEALGLYKEIQTKYTKSAQAREIDKYISRVEAKLGK